MNKLKLFLLTLVFPRIDGEDDLTPLNDDVPAEEDVLEPGPGDVDDDDGDVPGEDEGESKPKLSRAQQEIIKLRERAQLAEERERQARADIENARRQIQPQQPTEEQRLREQEDAVLNNPNAEEWQKYAIRSARDAREARREAQMARLESADAVDKARYERFKETKPALYNKYSEKVEELKRSQWANVPREEIQAILIGRDVQNGNLKSAETKPKAKVERGSTPGVRGDVPKGRSTMSEAEKRAKRLENVRI